MRSSPAVVLRRRVELPREIKRPGAASAMKWGPAEAVEVVVVVVVVVGLVVVGVGVSRP